MLDVALFCRYEENTSIFLPCSMASWSIYIFIFADVKYKNPNVLSQSFNLTIESLLRKNEEVPVKVEAAIALQMMLSSQGR